MFLSELFRTFVQSRFYVQCTHVACWDGWWASDVVVYCQQSTDTIRFLKKQTIKEHL